MKSNDELASKITHSQEWPTTNQNKAWRTLEYKQAQASICIAQKIYVAHLQESFSGISFPFLSANSRLDL